jgi:hypothetical protein
MRYAVSSKKKEAVFMGQLRLGALLMEGSLRSRIVGNSTSERVDDVISGSFRRSAKVEVQTARYHVSKFYSWGAARAYGCVPSSPTVDA